MAPNSCVFVYLIILGTATLSYSNNIPRISDGSLAQSQEFRCLTSIRVISRSNILVHICGGSVLSQKFVITAAHCVDNQSRGLDKYRVYVGDGEEFLIERITPHPLYNSVFLKNDLALIELAKPILFSSTVQPIQLHRGDLEDGALVTVVGLHVKKVNLHFLSIIT